MFDSDGRYHEGRADMNVQLEVEIKSRLTAEDFRERILFAWTCLRCKHLLLQAKAVSTKGFYGSETKAGTDVCFAVDVPGSVSQAVEDAGQQLVFLEDHYDYIDPWDFWTHCQNTGRVVDPAKALANMFVLPLEPLATGRGRLRVLKVGSHAIQDGLAMHIWMRDFVHFLNVPVPGLRKQLKSLLEPAALFRRLPLPQEALYPPISGSRARQRWFWLLTRILRHVRRPHPAGFGNPLRRPQPCNAAVPLSPVYSSVLDYTRLPPLNSNVCFVRTSLRNTRRLHRLCREVGASVGAGCFALAAMIMMEFHERQEPQINLADRRPFISGFPLDPRAFFNHHVEPDSLMLAFCDGISLPFLSSDLDLEGRLRLLIRQAHRQLAAFQKRPKIKGADEAIQQMGSRGAGRLLATQYVSLVERLEAWKPEHLRQDVSPQGQYPHRPNDSMQTCGVSSTGRREAIIRNGMYDLDDDKQDFVADYRNIHASVRPRDGEFLIGIGGAEDGLWANLSIDGNAIDPVLVQQWRRRFETVLDEEVSSNRPRL